MGLRYISDHMRGSLLGHFWNSFSLLLKERHIKGNCLFSALVTVALEECDAWNCGSNVVTIRVNHKNTCQHAENDHMERWK